MKTRAFTFVEVMVVVVIVGILAAIVVPQFGGLSDDARAASAQGSLGGVRSAISGFRTKQVLAGGAPFPTLAQLTTPGTVVQGEFPVNPFSNLSAVQSVSQGQASSRAVVNPAQFGWNYYVDNGATPPVAVFYCNSAQPTSVPNSSGGTRAANEL